ncbi:MAG: polyprenyl synthetase family protein [Candidatus Poseidoniaceae archaeon]|nr:polyprenyl synthetase family protein [Candidatus Poseidoniaceae archaeon]
MEEGEASGRLDAMRTFIDAELETLIKEQSVIHGEVARRAGEILLAGGKRLRPLMGLLVFELAGGVDLDEVLPFAIAFEMVHTATLVHDDINDEAATRRGSPTIHQQAGTAKGIIAGDWLFVQGFGLGGRYEGRLVDIMADCCARIASAEFSQLDHVLDLSTSPEDYLEIVEGKTAGPFSAVCEGAALIAGSTDEQASALARFGMELGIAFQLVDDILDIIGDKRMGKPRGADVHEGKMTLPLIHALTLLHGNDRRRLGDIVSDFDDTLFDELIGLLNRADSLSYTETLAKNHRERAANILDEFPESESKDLLGYVLNAVGNRHS